MLVLSIRWTCISVHLHDLEVSRHLQQENSEPVWLGFFIDINTGTALCSHLYSFVLD